MSDTTGALDERSSGWITFAGVMIMIAAVLNIIHGIGAIADSTFFIADAKYVLSNLNTWGWVLLLIGVIELCVAFGIWSGAQWARWTGVFIVGCNAIIQLIAISGYPFWSLAIFAVDILIIYGLAAHGGRGQATFD